MIKLGYFTHSRSKKKWETLEDIHVILSDGTPLLIPEGFRNDLSSVPRFLWWFMSPFGKIDNRIRYIGVRWFGGYIYRK